MSGDGHARELALARGLAESAGAVLRRHFLQAETEFKQDGSEVTAADREAERLIREGLLRAYPHDDVLGEEEGAAGGTSGRQWIVDPLDGTTWFSLGVPKFGTLIALAREREPVLGVVHFPMTGQSLYAVLGGGCWYARPGAAPAQVRVDGDRGLSDAFVSASGTHASGLQPGAGGRWNLGRLIAGAGRVRFVGDCYQHMLVAQGRLHAAVDTVMAPWDTAALLPCLREAGAVVSAIDGRRDQIAFAGSLVASCGERLHEQVLEALQP